MYDQHYGLNGRPFQLTPDPRFWYDTATHKKAMAYLGYGLSQGEGFIVITGDIGAGKTTLVGHLTATVDPDRLNVIKIVSTQIDADDLLRTVCAGLSVNADGLNKAQMLGAIERGLHGVARGGRRTLLIVDEAQALPVGSLEELRMLSNFQAGGQALLQIFLLGQPEFREKLADAGLEQLRQRVIAMHHLGPMEPDELEPYLAHRLGVVGWTGRPDFKVDALATIYAWSGGIPRRINQLVSRVMLHGAIEGIDTFAAADVLAVVDDLSEDGMTGGATHSVEPELDFSETPAAPQPIAAEAKTVGTPPPPIAAAPSPAAAAPAVMEWPFVSRDGDRDESPVADWRPIAIDPPVASEAVVDRPIVVEAPVPVEEPDVAPAATKVQPETEAALEDAIESAAEIEEQAGDDHEPVSATRPVEITAPPRLFERFPMRGRRSLLAPVDSAPETHHPAGADAAHANGAAPVIDLDIARRLAEIDRRLEDQDVALRRVLTLLVDWVEGGGARPDFAGQDFSGYRDKVG